MTTHPLSLLDYKILLQNAHTLYAASVVLLLLLWAPLGVERYHALRWLNFGAFSFQPSETAKIGVLVIAASILARSEIGSIRDSLSVLIKVGLVILLPIVLIFMQLDLATCFLSDK